MKRLRTILKLHKYARSGRKGLKKLKKGVDDPEGVLTEITKTLALGYLLWWSLMALLTLAVLYLLGFTDVFAFGPLEFFAVLFYIGAALLVIVAAWIIFLWLQLKKLARGLHDWVNKRRAQDVDDEPDKFVKLGHRKSESDEHS